ASSPTSTDSNERDPSFTAPKAKPTSTAPARQKKKPELASSAISSIRSLAALLRLLSSASSKPVTLPGKIWMKSATRLQRPAKSGRRNQDECITRHRSNHLLLSRWSRLALHMELPDHALARRGICRSQARSVPHRAHQIQNMAHRPYRLRGASDPRCHL